MELSFGVMERVFIERFAISPEREPAFRSRLQHLQRRKIFDTNTGRGTKASYQWGHVIQLMVTLDLIDLGMTPEAAASRVARHTDQIIAAVRQVVVGFKSQAKLVKAIQNQRCPMGNTRILLTSAALLSFEKAAGEGEFLLTSSSSEFSEWLATDAALNPAIALIDLGSRMMLVANLVGRHMFPDPSSTAIDLQKWLETHVNADSLS